MASSFEDDRSSDPPPAEVTRQVFSEAVVALQPFLHRVIPIRATGCVYPPAVLGSGVQLSIYCAHEATPCDGKPRPMDDLHLSVSFGDNYDPARVGLTATGQTQEDEATVDTVLRELYKNLSDDTVVQWLKTAFAWAINIRHPANLPYAACAIEALFSDSPFPRTNITCSHINYKFPNGTSIDGTWAIFSALNGPEQRLDNCQILLRKRSGVRYDYGVIGNAEHLRITPGNTSDSTQTPPESASPGNRGMIDMICAIFEAVHSANPTELQV